MTTATKVIDTACALAERGYYVFPVTKSKVPFADTKGFYDAVCTPNQVINLFNQFKSPQVAVATGQSGLLALDVDCKDGKPGYANRNKMEEKYGKLPRTVEANTPSGGYHHIFSGKVKSSTDEIDLGLDVKSVGGYIVVPPSKTTKGPYIWVPEHSLLDITPEPAPDWLIDLATIALPTTTRKGAGDSDHRNVSLTSQAGKLKRAGVEGSQLEAALLIFNQTFSLPLSEKEVCKIAKSVDKYPTGTTVSDNDTDTAEVIAMGLEGRYAWDYVGKSWMAYQPNQGMWTREDSDMMIGVVAKELKQLRGIGQNVNKIRAVESLMRPQLTHKFDEASRELLPMANGVLNLETMEILPHKPDYYFTWSVPYGYVPTATCQLTKAWLLEAMQGDSELVDFLRAYLRAVILGRADCQVFLENYGPGGSGKGTYTRLAQALVGVQNTHPTRLKELENGKFETANVYGKRLTIINEAESYVGSVDVLKSMTGGDSIHLEEKYKQAAAGGFVYGGMVIISGNQPLKTNEYTSGLARRRLSVVFGKASNQSRDLLRIFGHKPLGELAHELPGVLNWVLEMSEQQMRALLAPGGTGTKQLRETRQDTLMKTNPLADWVYNNLVYEPGIKTSQRAMYENYKDWCENEGGKPFSNQNFSGNLLELLNNLYGYGDVEQIRGKLGMVFVGARLRRHTEDVGEFGSHNVEAAIG